jgi:hypothetical protein
MPSATTLTGEVRSESMYTLINRFSALHGRQVVGGKISSAKPWGEGRAFMFVQSSVVFFPPSCWQKPKALSGPSVVRELGSRLIDL